MSNSQLKCLRHVQLDTRERHLPVLIAGGRFEELPGVAHNLWVTDRAVTPRQIREVLKSAQGTTSCGRALNFVREAAGLQPLSDAHDNEGG